MKSTLKNTHPYNVGYQCGFIGRPIDEHCYNLDSEDLVAFQEGWVQGKDEQKGSLETLAVANPKDVIGTAKVPFSTVPSVVIAEIGLAMMEGARKYGRHNYRVQENGQYVRASVYYDAFMRHMTDWWEGEDIDPESGLSHLTKAMACLVILRDAQIMNTVDDDRPPKSPKGWQADLNAKAAALVEKYPKARNPATEAGRPDAGMVGDVVLAKKLKLDPSTLFDKRVYAELKSRNP